MATPTDWKRVHPFDVVWARILTVEENTTIKGNLTVNGVFNTALGAVVGTDDAQVLTNKTINSDNNTITNIVNADIKATAAIDATKIADGTVTSAEFQFINSLSSNAQTQIDTHLADTTAHGVLSDIVTTTDATVTTISTIASATDTSYIVEAKVLGRRTDSGSETGGYSIHSVLRNVSGTLTVVGSNDTVSIEDVVGWDAEVVAVGTNIIIRVTGAAASTVNWISEYKVVSV